MHMASKLERKFKRLFFGVYRHRKIIEMAFWSILLSIAVVGNYFVYKDIQTFKSSNYISFQQKIED